jgi:hypothetical protein
MPDLNPAEIVERLRTALDEFEGDYDEATEREDRPDLWDQVVEVSIPDARAIVEALSAPNDLSEVERFLTKLSERHPPESVEHQEVAKLARQVAAVRGVPKVGREEIARALHEAHKPFCDHTYPFEHPMASRHVYETLADAILALAAPDTKGESAQTDEGGMGQ